MSEYEKGNEETPCACGKMTLVFKAHGAIRDGILHMWDQCVPYSNAKYKTVTDISSSPLCVHGREHNWDAWHLVGGDLVSPHPITGKYYYYTRECQNMGCCERELAQKVEIVGDTFRFDSDAVRVRGEK